MRRQTSRMQRLIEDLLQLAALESEADRETHEVLNVPEMLAGIARDARDFSGIMNHNINLQVDPALFIKGSYKEVHSAFSNIVFNAIKYSPAQADIGIRWYRDEEGAHLAVRDHGEGITAEHLPRLTERFYRVDAGRSREKGGTGLGLAIVKHVLSRHKARLEIESIPGDGSIFRCDFPTTVVTDKPREGELHYKRA